MKLSVIFEDKPQRWGFRGDPYFWDYLKVRAENMDILSPEELEQWIKEEYFSLSGKTLTDKYMDFAVIKQFAHGGMSSGGVDNGWWSKEGIPLLKSRLAALDKSGFAEVHEMSKTVEELLQCPCWIIDILPSQVSKDSPGQYFAVEKYFLKGDRMQEIKQKHINLILKLNCYRDISFSDKTVINPLPKHIADEMKKRHLYIMIGESMILSEPDDTHLTVFNPDPQLLELIRQIASGEGLFVWKPTF